MTEKQEAALRGLAEGPQQLHAGTGTALVRRGYATRSMQAGWYAITEEGSRELARKDRVTLVQGQRDRLLMKDRKLLARVQLAEAWLEVHDNLEWPARRYAREVMIAILIEEEPPLSPWENWGEETDRFVQRQAETALRALDDLDAARKEAQRIGASIVVSYEAGRARPVRAREWKLERLAAARGDGGVVDLTTYRDG